MRLRLVIALIGLALNASAASSSMESDDSFASVNYQGELILLAKTYENFHDYKDDPENLPPAIRPKVAQLVRSAPAPRSFRTRKEADDIAFKLMFPGYGLSMFQLHDPIALYSVEIPYMDEDRWLVMKQEGQAWMLLDDFVWPKSAGYIDSATLENGRLLYKDRNGKILRERPKTDA